LRRRRHNNIPTVHLVNPSTQSFGVAVITPRWSEGAKRRERAARVSDRADQAGDVDHVEAIDQIDDARLGLRQRELAPTIRKESE
jgi:hypothetical protein